MQQQSDFTDVLSAFGPIIENEIKAEINSEAETWLNGALNYHFGWTDQNFNPLQHPNRGKKLRPVMALLSYQGVKNDKNISDLSPVLPVAAAIEMIHNYSLIHDDIEDGDLERHSRPTVWAVWGIPQAINLGDYLHVLAFRRLYRSIEHGIEPDRVLRMAEKLATTSIRLAQGQHRDLAFEDDLNVSPDMYLEMIGGKTAALLGCSTFCGALAASSDETILEKFTEFGEKIGLGFQIRDDILGIWGAAEKTGKSAANDIKRRKKSLPVIYALSESRGQTLNSLKDIYSGTEPLAPQEVQYVLAALEETKAREYAQIQADRYKVEALSALEEAAGGTLEDNLPLMKLKNLCTFLVQRSY